MTKETQEATIEHYVQELESNEPVSFDSSMSPEFSTFAVNLAAGLSYEEEIFGQYNINGM